MLSGRRRIRTFHVEAVAGILCCECPRSLRRGRAGQQTLKQGFWNIKERTRSMVPTAFTVLWPVGCTKARILLLEWAVHTNFHGLSRSSLMPLRRCNKIRTTFLSCWSYLRYDWLDYGFTGELLYYEYDYLPARDNVCAKRASAAQKDYLVGAVCPRKSLDLSLQKEDNIIGWEIPGRGISCARSSCLYADPYS